MGNNLEVENIKSTNKLLRFKHFTRVRTGIRIKLKKQAKQRKTKVRNEMERECESEIEKENEKGTALFVLCLSLMST